MAASDMMSALMELCQEKHIDQLYLIDRLSSRSPRAMPRSCILSGAPR